MNYACLSLIVNFAAGRGEKAIHDDIEGSLLEAKTRSLRLMQQLFNGTPQRGAARPSGRRQ
jgi:hypothetical protein